MLSSAVLKWALALVSCAAISAATAGGQGLRLFDKQPDRRRLFDRTMYDAEQDARLAKELATNHTRAFFEAIVGKDAFAFNPTHSAAVYHKVTRVAMPWLTDRTPDSPSLPVYGVPRYSREGDAAAKRIGERKMSLELLPTFWYTHVHRIAAGESGAAFQAHTAQDRVISHGDNFMPGQLRAAALRHAMHRTRMDGTPRASAERLMPVIAPPVVHIPRGTRLVIKQQPVSLIEGDSDCEPAGTAAMGTYAELRALALTSWLSMPRLAGNRYRQWQAQSLSSSLLPGRPLDTEMDDETGAPFQSPMESEESAEATDVTSYWSADSMPMSTVSRPSALLATTSTADSSLPCGGDWEITGFHEPLNMSVFASARGNSVEFGAPCNGWMCGSPGAATSTQTAVLPQQSWASVTEFFVRPYGVYFANGALLGRMDTNNSVRSHKPNNGGSLRKIKKMLRAENARSQQRRLKDAGLRPWMLLELEHIPQTLPSFLETLGQAEIPLGMAFEWIYGEAAGVRHLALSIVDRHMQNYGVSRVPYDRVYHIGGDSYLVPASVPMPRRLDLGISVRFEGSRRAAVWTDAFTDIFKRRRCGNHGDKQRRRGPQPPRPFGECGNPFEDLLAKPNIVRVLPAPAVRVLEKLAPTAGRNIQTVFRTHFSALGVTREQQQRIVQAHSYTADLHEYATQSIRHYYF